MSERRALGYRKAESDLQYNTFIGGVGNVITTALLMSDKLVGVSESDIKNYQVDANGNISFFIDVAYEWKASAFHNHDQLTYYFDTDGHCVDGGYRTLNSLTAGAIKLIVPNMIVYGTQMFRYSHGAVYMVFPLMTIITNGYQHLYGTQTQRFYVPIATISGDQSLDSGMFNRFSAFAVIYIHPSMETSNGGLPNANLFGRPNYATTTRYVTNFTSPDRVIDLSASNITSDGCDLHFTPPSSANLLDFYEVWIDDGTNNPVHIYHAFDEITATGETLSGLSSGVVYKIKVFACDVFWNRSLVSNEIQITTL